MAPPAPSSSWFGAKPNSWWSRWWSSLFQPTKTLGTLWQGTFASTAFKQKELCTLEESDGDNNKSLRLCFRNYTPIPLLLCWISSDHTPHHFYTLPICANENTDLVTSQDRLETTRVGHAFCLARKSEHTKKQVLDPSCILGGYRPLTSCGEDDVHIISIYQSTNTKRKEKTTCCQAPWGLRGRHPDDETIDEEEYYSNDDFFLTVTQGSLDSTPIDTSAKVYKQVTIGGWPCRVEQNWHGGNKRLQKILQRDLQYATRHLPQHAREFLKQNTPIYINASQQYGSTVCPVNGKGLCFHPGKSWLCDMGMSPDKCQCIELYNASDYIEDACQWGPGGVFLHELAHAYHWKVLKGGYQNAEIVECYKRAMKEGLYDCVLVKTRNGITRKQKAYACTNPMEYFAELSTAFLGGLDDDTEYNKWFPYCREQIKQHDPRAYKLLQKLWNVECNS